MPRTARLNVPGVVYHVISRFVDHSWFITEDVERARYLQLFERAMEVSDWRCLSYALMSSHTHHGMVAGESSLQAWAKAVNGPFAQWMNHRHDRAGPMMAGRPADWAVLPENEGPLLAYIHNNPVRAGVVARARESDWTSHRAYLGKARAPAWLHVDEGLARTGVADAASFDAFVDGTEGQSGEVPNLPGIHRAARRRGAIELGTPTAGTTPIIPLVMRPFGHIRPDPRRIVELVAGMFGVPLAIVCSRQRNPAALAARRVAVHCGVAMGLSGADLASALGLSPQAVSKISRRNLEDSLRTMFASACERAQDELWASRRAV